ncbi:MAG: hypothetical protein EBS82_06780 [Methylocystaceae bacterium]|nr:hypothetical protein [Methylocystaceae bacterium]NBT96560.1 hypothetical protein [Methylocystaceae bacterium]
MYESKNKYASQKEKLFTLSERLEHGMLKPQEVWSLAGKAKTTFYEDVKAGKVVLRKIGLRSSGVYGPDAKRYIESCLSFVGD